MKSLLILVDSVVTIYIWILIINAILSWLIAFNILNTSNRLVYSLLDVSYKMTDPLLRPIRNFLPNLGGIDISPVVLILLLMFARNLVFEFLNRYDIELSKINNIFVNQGPGKYTSIRSAISLVKAINVSMNINIYGYFSSQITNNNYKNLINLLEEGRLTKNFIQPKYLN